MVLALCPVTAFAEGESREPITEISIEIQSPIVGEHLSGGWSTSSNPVSTIGTTIKWMQILKTDYTGREDDPWQLVWGFTPTCSEDYYYRFICDVKVYDRFVGTYFIPDDVDATINGKECDIVVADDGNSCTMTYLFEAKTPQPISSIDFSLEEPALGKTPDYNVMITADYPQYSLEPYWYIGWYKLPKNLSPDLDNTAWEEMDEDEVFTEGYYYAAEIWFYANDTHYFNANTLLKLNGKAGRNPDYLEDDAAGLIAIFDPLEADYYTVTASFSVTVEPFDRGEPGETTFELETVNGQGEPVEFDGVKVTASVTTDGAGTYPSTMSISGSIEDLRDMLIEGVYVRQVNEGKANWNYDDGVWALFLKEGIVALDADDDAAPTYSILIFPTILEETENGEYYEVDWNGGPVKEMSFINTYASNQAHIRAEDLSEPDESTKPAGGNSSSGDKSNPQTGDSNGLALCAALIAVSAAGMATARLSGKRGKNGRAK